MQTTPSDRRRLTAGEGALRPYLRAIRAHLFLALVIVLVTVGASISYVLLRSPSYEATANLLVNPVPQDDTTFRGLNLLRESGDPVRTVQTAAALIDSQLSAALAAKQLGDGFTAKEVLDRTEVTPLGESNVLAVIARASDPSETARIANQFARSALTVRRRALRAQVNAELKNTEAQLNALPRLSPLAAELAGRFAQLRTLRDGRDPSLELSEAAIPATSPTETPASLVLVLSLLGGLTIGAGTALLLELIDWRIRDEEDLLRLASPPALARVPKLSRKEASRAAGTPSAAPPGVREGFRSLQIQLDQDGPGHRCVMITSASAGDGKTSSAINLAAAAAEAGYRPVLLDLDLRKPDIGPNLGLDPADGNVLSLVASQGRLADVLVSAPWLPGVQVLPAPADAEFAEVERMTQAMGRWLPGILGEAKALADYVIIDTAPLGEVSDALRIATQVDDVVLVARLGHTRRDSFQTTSELLEHAACTVAGLVMIGGRLPTAGYGYGYYQQPAGPGPAAESEGGRRKGPAKPASQPDTGPEPIRPRAPAANWREARPEDGLPDGEPARRAAREATPD